MTTTSTTSTTSDLTWLARELRSSLRGATFIPGDDGYEAAVQAWNLTVVQHPAVAVAPVDAADLALAVRTARAHGVAVAIQATGHGVARPADGALLILTGALDQVSVDPVTETATVGAGVRWGAVLAAAQEHGLAPLLGSSPDVGAVGYTLGGGMGWLARRFGLASDSVRSFELVTPDGLELHASATENATVFEALRGGGAGTLGVVTSMEIDLYPVSTVYGGSLFYPADDAREVVRRWLTWTATVDDDVTSSVSLMNFPPFEAVPEPLRGRSFVLLRACFVGDLDRAAATVDAWRAWRAPEIDLFRAMPFAEVGAISMDPEEPTPARLSTEWFDEVTDEVVEVLVDATYPQGGPPGLVFSELRHAGGAISRSTATGTGRRGRDGRFLLCLLAPTQPGDDSAADAHLAATRARLAPFATGATYLNFTDGGERRERTASAFSEAELRQLGAVKALLDPDGRFDHGLDLSAAVGTDA